MDISSRRATGVPVFSFREKLTAVLKKSFSAPEGTALEL